MSDHQAFIKRVDTTLPFPHYKTEGAAAFDLCARLDTTIPPSTFARVPLNVMIKPPQGYWSLLVPRSSLHKKGLMPGNGIGIIDPDYCGDTDEYQAVLFNATHEPVTIERGERIMQVAFMPMVQATLQEVTMMEAPNRGGFGSTGK